MLSKNIDWDAIKNRLMLAAGTTNFTEAVKRFGCKGTPTFYAAKRKNLIPDTWKDKALVNLGVDPKWLFWGFEEGEPGAIEAELRRRNQGQHATALSSGAYLTAEEAEAITLAKELAAPRSENYDPNKHFLIRVQGQAGAVRLAVATELRPVAVVTSPHPGLESGRLLEYCGLALALEPVRDTGLLPRPHSQSPVALRNDLAESLLQGQGLWARVTQQNLEPVLMPRDLALLDLGQTRPEPDHIYALAVGGILVLRRLLLDGDQWVLAANDVAPMPYDPASDTPRLLGRVVWVGREL